MGERRGGRGGRSGERGGGESLRRRRARVREGADRKGVILR